MTEEDNLIDAQEGDEESVEKIFKQYNALVHKNSKAFFLKGADYEDLVQEGFIGLLNAVKNYDNSKNASFATFAHICIRRQIITAVKNSNSDKFKYLNESVGKIEEQDKLFYRKPSITFGLPDEILLGKELLNLLEEYLSNNLSKFEKKVFYYLIKQYTYIEIAKILNDTPKRIDNTIQRVKKKIRSYLKSYSKFN